MGKIRLRIGQGVRLTPELLDELARRFECRVDEIEIESYGLQDDLQQIYSTKKESIADAFRFAMQAWPPTCDAGSLEKYLAWCDEQTPLPDAANNNVNDYQRVLGQYLTKMLNGVMDFWPVADQDAAIKFLNKADQYNVMSNGRPDLASLSLAGDGKEIILRWDKQLPACSEITLDELDSIKRGAPGLTPDWFRKLPVSHQLYLQGSDNHLLTAGQLSDDLYKLQLTWFNQKSKGSDELYNELMAIKDNGDVPTWYLGLPPSHQLFIRELSFDVKKASELPGSIEGKFNGLTQTITKLDPLQLSQLGRLRRLPYWYTAFPEFEQRFLQKALAKVRHIADAVFFIPSRLRTIPALSNFRESHASLYSPTGQLITDFGSELCFSHVASRDVKNQSQQIRDLHSDRNIARLVQEGRKTGKAALFLQTLVSPSQALSAFIPDFELTEQLRRGVQRVMCQLSFRIFTSNHPFNAYKYWGYTTEINNGGCSEFLAYALKRLGSAAIRAEWNALFEQSEPVDPNAMLDQCFAFIKTSPDHRVFGQLMQLVHKLAPVGRDPAHCLALVKAAWSDALLLLHSPERLAGRSSPVTPEAKAHVELLEFFAGNIDNLSRKDLPDWSACLANLWYLSGHANKPTPNRLRVLASVTHVAELVCGYSDLLWNKSFMQKTFWDYNGREMTLAMQEGLLAQHLGDIQMSGSCISGKDRKGLYLLCVLAAKTYHHRFGYWPNYSDTGTDRAHFVDILADLYIARHDAVHSGQNAPGADGIKHPHKYFPADVVAAIESRIGAGALKKHDRIASNNELKDIPLGGKVEKDRARCVLTALMLGEEGRQALLDRIKIITDESDYWASKVGIVKWTTAKTTSMAKSLLSKSNFFSAPVISVTAPAAPAPTAVESSRTVFANTESSSMDAMVGLCMAFLQRPPEENAASTRDPDTQAYYDCLLTLIDSRDPMKDLPATLLKLDEIKLKAFRFNSKSPEPAFTPQMP